MLQLFPPSRRLFHAFAAAAVIAVLTAVAGCGGADKTAATAPTPVSPVVQPTSPSPEATSPAPSTPDAIQPSKDLPQHAPKPSNVPSGAVPGAPTSTAKENTLSPATPSDKLIVKSPSGTDPKWRVAAQLQADGVACLTVTSLGQSTPTPDCESGTQLAIELLTNAGFGQGFASVAGIQRTVRNPPTDILVSGTITGDVERVFVNYRHKRYAAKVSAHTVELPVETGQVKSVDGRPSLKVAKKISIKVFGLSIPEATGNPPTSAVLKRKHPVDGSLTFQLQ